MFVWSVLAIELTLKWNHVTGVYEVTSTGQLIPLVLGITLTATITWQAIRLKVGSIGPHLQDDD